MKLSTSGLTQLDHEGICLSTYLLQQLMCIYFILFSCHFHVSLFRIIIVFLFLELKIKLLLLLIFVCFFV